MMDIIGTEQIRIRERCNTAKIAIETAIRSLEGALLFQTDDDIRCKINVLRNFHRDLVKRLDEEQEKIDNVAERLETLSHRAQHLSARCFVKVSGDVGLWDKDQVMLYLDILSNRADSLSEDDLALLAQVSDAVVAIERAMEIKAVLS
jgi:Tfp pilus assembly protein PilN